MPVHGRESLDRAKKITPQVAIIRTRSARRDLVPGADGSRDCPDFGRVLPGSVDEDRGLCRVEESADGNRRAGGGELDLRMVCQDRRDRYVRAGGAASETRRRAALGDSSNNVRYNIYRGSASGVHPDKLNAAPVDALSFTDSRVQKGKRYYYVARAIDAAGQESSDSNETVVTIP